MLVLLVPNNKGRGMFLSSEHDKGASNRLLDRYHGPSENHTARLMNPLRLLLDDKKEKKKEKNIFHSTTQKQHVSA